MVLEQHGDVPRAVVAVRAETAEQEVGNAHGLVAVLLVGPLAVVLDQEYALGHLGVARARFDLRADARGSVDARRRGGAGQGSARLLSAR